MQPKGSENNIKLSYSIIASIKNSPTISSKDAVVLFENVLLINF